MDPKGNSTLSTNPKLALYESFAVVAKALGHAHRLQLLEQIGQGEQSVETLASATGLSIANASQHLLQLRRAGLALSRRDGKQVLYRLSGNEIVDLLSALRGTAERNVAEAQNVIAGYFLKQDTMEPVSREELIKRLRQKSVTLLDVRPESEFAMGHIPGAVSLPLQELKRRLKDLPRDREIVAYCRGPYCILSFEAVALLRKQGFTVRRFADGLPEWRAAGMQVER